MKRLRLTLGLTVSLNLQIKPLPINSFSLFSYAFMPNHFHFLIRQNSTIGLDKLILKLTTSYGIFFNKKYNRVGPLFQDTFKAKPVDTDEYLIYLSAYIHNNPKDPLNYPYSSFQEILGMNKNCICDRKFLLSFFNNDPNIYKKFVLGFSKTDEERIEDLLFNNDDQP